MQTIVGKTAFVDLSAASVAIEDTPRPLVRQLLGGRGANMAYLHQRVPPDADPLGPDNLLIFGAGLLTGYPVPNSGRMNISAKSPESGILGDANMGGAFPTAMRRAGFDRLVITGCAATPVYLLLTPGAVEIRAAEDYWGLRVGAAQEALARDLGAGVSAAVIGPAGENRVRFACVMTGRKNAAGRGGMGAVMGSKRLKAVAVVGARPLPSADRSALLALRKRLNQHLLSSKIIQAYGKVGTALLYQPANTLGTLRTKNGQCNQWSANFDAEQLEPHTLRMTACSGCVVRCRHVNRHGGEGPDFSSTALLGANLGIDDLTAVIELNNLCNDLGLDTSSTGAVLAWAMELYQRGLIGDDRTGGPLRWGDAARVRELVLAIAQRRGFGDVLAESSQAPRLGKLPRDAAAYLLAVKGLPQSDPHDPRYIKSFALGLAVASRGADHLRNRPTLDILGLPDAVREEVYGARSCADPAAYEGKEVGVVFSETIYAVCDCLGICRFVCHGWNSPKLLGYAHFAEMLRCAVGLDLSSEELQAIGCRVVDLERQINRRAGLSAADDTLPRRYFDEPLPGGQCAGQRIDREAFGRLLLCYYRRRGWDERGRLPPRRVRQVETAAAAAGTGPTQN